MGFLYLVKMHSIKMQKRGVFGKMLDSSLERLNRLGIPRYLVKRTLPVRSKIELEEVANKCNIPWYLKPYFTEDEQKEQQQLVVATKSMELPLIERLRLGMDYCTKEEFHSFLWLKRFFEGILYRERFLGEVNALKLESHFFGVCGFEIKYAECNPWIVNAIMNQLGVPLHSFQEFDVVVGQERIPYSVQLTYKTFEVGIVNEMIEMP